VAWIASIGTDTSFGRSLCIAPDGKLWVGIWNQGRYYRVDPANGATLPIPGSNAPYVQLSGWNPYGCTVDKNGMLWSANLLYSGVGWVNTLDGTSGKINSPYSAYNYGIAQGNAKIYQAPYAGGYGWAAYNPAASTWSRSALNYSGAGIAIDGAGNILSTDYSGVYKYAPDGTVLWYAPGGGGTTYGVMVDGNNDVWMMNLSFNTVKKFNGVNGNLITTLSTGSYPYVYTDGSGLTTKTQTNNTQGTWTVVYDSGAAGTKWGKVNWNDFVPAGATVEVSARAANATAALDLQTYLPVSKNTAFATTGQYVQVRTRLITNANRDSPILFDLTVSSAIVSCDVDGDGDVDLNDLSLIRAAIGQTPVANDPRDGNGDGLIDIRDVRACTFKCTRASCATN
jgi:hypothetical protein